MRLTKSVAFRRGFIKLQRNTTMVTSSRLHQLQRNATMVKLPAWDTPTWRLARELRPLYAAVNRVRELEATPGASKADIGEAQRAVGAAVTELTRLVDAMRLFQAKQATVRYFGRA